MNTISIIAAMGKNNELGKDNQLLWYISGDLKRFKSLTSGHPVIMGRKTFESLKNGPLTNRRNIVFTSNRQFNRENIEIVHDTESAFKILTPNDEAFVIGGEAIYKLFLPYAHKLYLTLVNKSYEADVFFPKLDASEWKEVERVDISSDIQAGVDYSYVTFERKPNYYNH